MIIHDTVSILIEQEGKILLVQRRNKPEKGYWAVPGGHVDKGETPYDAARREAAEEVGAVAVRKGNVLMFVHDVDIGHRHRAHVFRGAPCGKVRAGSDAARAAWFSIGAMKRMNLTHYTKYIVNRLFQV